MPNYAFVGNETVGAYVASRLEPLGWKRAGDIAAASMVLSYCTTQGALEDAYFDEDGIIKNARPSTLLIDLSPASPSFSRELSAVATVNDLVPVEAPLCVKDVTASAAFGSPENVMCFVSGEEGDVDEAVDVLETLAGEVVRTGGCGTAQLAKAVRTIQVTAQLVSACEADALARVMRDTTPASLECGLCMTDASGVKRALAAVEQGAFEGAFTIEMLNGEVAAAMAAADDVELILPQLESAMHLIEVIAIIGGSVKAPAALALLYRDEATSAAAGLDWTRAEELYANYGDDGCGCGHDDDCGCGHDHSHGHYHHDHDHGFGDDDDFGFANGFGAYSAN